jgi:PAS domain S-box-containing protein
LVVLSVVVSIVGAHAAIDLAERVRDARGRARAAWLLGNALADAAGTWSMHYTGKLALRLPAPLELDWRVVLLSYAVGVAGSLAALLVIGRGRIGWLRAIVAGIFLGGAGVSGLHYTAMHAIVFPQVHHYNSPGLLVLSVVLAIVISCVSLPLAFHIWADTHVSVRTRRIAATLLRGAANPVMHYTAMAAVVFVYPAVRPELSHAVPISALGVIGIVVVPVMVLAVALLTSVVDRVERQRVLLHELFEQAPYATVLIADGERIARVNREFTRLFGFRPEEAVGRRLDDLIVPTGERPPPRGRRVEFESMRRRKDGVEIPVTIVRVPVTVPGGQVEAYAILQDISERKRAEEALRAYPARLIEAQETQAGQIARELHDEIGQVLTGVRMMLGEGSGANVTEAQDALQELTERVRKLALDLRPPLLEHFGLLPSIEALLERYTRQTGIRIELEHSGVDGRRFAPEVEIAAYRIVQEALTNVARHANVREAAVRVRADEDTLTVEVEDRGRGIDAAPAPAESLGIAGMRERANALGGALSIVAPPGGGTRVTATLPLTAYLRQ